MNTEAFLIMQTQQSVQQQPPRPSFNNPTVKELLGKYRSIAALNHCSSLLGWDLEVNMPEQGARARGVAAAEMELMTQTKTVALAGLVGKGEKEKGLNDFEKGVVRVAGRDLYYYQKVPPALVEELQKAYAEAAFPWREARKKSDFNIFKPHLEKIVELKRQEAERLEPEGHIYNGLLDLYDEGTRTSDLDKIFSGLIPSLKKILATARTRRVLREDHPLEKVKYDPQAMKRVNEKLIELLAMPGDRFRLDVSTHPFTSKISRDDVRITVRYEGIDFKGSMFSLIHECGHAIYELQVAPELEFTPIGRGVSSGLHESQSRFWENIIGRSRDFVSLVYPMLKQNLGFLSGYDEHEVYRYINTVKTSLIRVDADELTYNFHIAMRYELEKKLLEGKIAVSDLPSTWNDMIEDYLGKRPHNDAEGVLQDIHWSAGGFAVFPSYSLGNIVAGMIWSQLKKQALLRLDKATGLIPYRNWLRDNLHAWGATYPPKQLLTHLFGHDYDPQGLVQYLEQKYLAPS